ncbi:MAG TPA: PilZ domain-containing protein [Rudaea sp.]
MTEHRRSLRKRAQQAIEVTNAISGEVIGYVGNLSEDGMLLISGRALPEDALFQFTFPLQNPSGPPQKIEIGVHEQWCEAAAVPGQFWTGFRIIDIGPEDQKTLSAWVHSPAGTYQ